MMLRHQHNHRQNRKQTRRDVKHYVPHRQHHHCNRLRRRHHVQCRHAPTLDEVMHFPFAAWPNEFVRFTRNPHCKLENTLDGYLRSSVEHWLTADMKKCWTLSTREHIEQAYCTWKEKQELSKQQAAALFEERHGCCCCGILSRAPLFGGCSLFHLRRRRRRCATSTFCSKPWTPLHLHVPSTEASTEGRQATMPTHASIHNR
jgi:hypothetical protein